jgi:ribonuclease BN (tRNA processing enzyme)
MPLDVQLLPTSPGDRSQTQPLTSFLVNRHIAIDAGSFGLSLPAEQLADVHHVILTHAHLDHVASLPIAIAEVYPRLRQPMRVYATPDVLKAVHQHLFNGVIWPDFSKLKLPQGNQMSLEFIPIQHRQPFEIEGLRFTPIPVCHKVPTIGLIVDAPDASVMFTSDTCQTDEIWTQANTRPNLQAVFIDCSFPDELEELAVESGHLTPRLVAEESKKLTSPARVLCVHIKPDSREKVIAQILPHRTKRMSAVEIGKTYSFTQSPTATPAPTAH